MEMTRSRSLLATGRPGSWIDIDRRIAWLVPVRVLKIPEDGPKRKLLDAAESLVAEKGFDTVSVRDVTGAVKANVAAVNYHFGSREGLLDLVMTRILEPLCEERLAAMDQIERRRAGKAVVVLEDIIAAYVNALSTTARRLDMEQSYFLKIAGRILVFPEENLAPVLAALCEKVRERFLTALTRALPETPPAELAAGWRIFGSGLSQSLVTLAPGEDSDQLLSLWAAFGIKGLGGGKPPKEAKKEDPQEMLFDF